LYARIPVSVFLLPRREKQEQMEKQLNESTLHRLTAGQNGFNAQEQAAKGRLVSQVGEEAAWEVIMRSSY
jgi:hypothetical protein